MARERPWKHPENCKLFVLFSGLEHLTYIYIYIYIQGALFHGSLIAFVAWLCLYPLTLKFDFEFVERSSRKS